MEIKLFRNDELVIRMENNQIVVLTPVEIANDGTMHLYCTTSGIAITVIPYKEDYQAIVDELNRKNGSDDTEYEEESEEVLDEMEEDIDEMTKEEKPKYSRKTRDTRDPNRDKRPVLNCGFYSTEEFAANIAIGDEIHIQQNKDARNSFKTALVLKTSNSQNFYIRWVNGGKPFEIKNLAQYFVELIDTDDPYSFQWNLWLEDVEGTGEFDQRRKPKHDKHAVVDEPILEGEPCELEYFVNNAAIGDVIRVNRDLSYPEKFSVGKIHAKSDESFRIRWQNGRIASFDLDDWEYSTTKDSPDEMEWQLVPKSDQSEEENDSQEDNDTLEVSETETVTE